MSFALPPHLAVGLALVWLGLALHARAHQRLKPLVDFPFIQWPKRYLSDGIFRLRHPAYLGNLTMIAGVGALALGWGGLVLALGALPFYADRILREELLRDGWQEVQSCREAQSEPS